MGNGIYLVRNRLKWRRWVLKWLAVGPKQLMQYTPYQIFQFSGEGCQLSWDCWLNEIQWPVRTNAVIKTAQSGEVTVACNSNILNYVFHHSKYWATLI